MLAAQIRRFPDLEVDALNVKGLQQRDAGLAEAIYGVTLRRWITLRTVLEHCLDRPSQRLDPRVGAVLLAGAAQILFLDRVPPHAACSEAATWVRKIAGEPKTKLVNAVLRRLCRLALDEHENKRRLDTYTGGRNEIPLPNGGCIDLGEEVLPEDPLERLSAATSVPAAHLRAWLRAMPMRDVRELAMHCIVQPPIILNTAGATDGLAAHVRPHSIPGHHVFDGSHDQLLKLLQSTGNVWVQDPASSLAVEMAGDLQPELVVDVCAGKGTKTRQLARQFPDATIVATDIDEPRMQVLRQTLRGSDVMIIDYERLIEWGGKADLVLLDVPCSNSGVLGRRLEARYRVSDDRIGSLVATQRQIIADSIRLLKGGAGSGAGMLYSTCSLGVEENEEQAAWAARWHGLRVDRESRRLPSGTPDTRSETYCDGSYAALLR